MESDFDFDRYSTSERFGAGYFAERLMDNHRAAYNNDTYDFNRRMRTSRDFGQVHQKLVKKVHGFYKTNTELLADLIVMDYDELINDFGLTLNEARWETNSNHKFEIDTRYKFKCRPIPQKVEFDLEQKVKR